MSHSLENTDDSRLIDLEENSLLSDNIPIQDEEKTHCLSSRTERKRALIILTIALVFVVFCVSMFLVINFQGFYFIHLGYIQAKDICFL